jgi:glyoxylase-like metal-dependent hydrolase (beta-lactamase superfamily II)
VAETTRSPSSTRLGRRGAGRERAGFRALAIDTHIHADHVSVARRLAAATGAELCLHESAEVRFPFTPLRDGDVLPLGNVSLRVLHTPGHRPESITLLVVNTARAEEPSMAITGTHFSWAMSAGRISAVRKAQMRSLTFSG